MHSLSFAIFPEHGSFASDRFYTDEANGHSLLGVAMFWKRVTWQRICSCLLSSHPGLILQSIPHSLTTNREILGDIEVDSGTVEQRISGVETGGWRAISGIQKTAFLVPNIEELLALLFGKVVKTRASTMKFDISSAVSIIERLSVTAGTLKSL